MLKKGKIFPWQSFDHQKSPISLQKVAIGEWPLQPDNRHEMGEQPKENHSPSITIPRRYDYSHPQIDGIGNPNKTLKMMYFSIYLGRTSCSQNDFPIQISIFIVDVQFKTIIYPHWFP